MRPIYMEGRTVAKATPHPIVVALLERAQRAGLSPLALCNVAGLHHSVMNRWRGGDSSPTLSSLQRVIDALDKYERKEAKKKAPA